MLSHDSQPKVRIGKMVVTACSVVASASIVACLVALVLICVSKSYRYYLNRLILYLTLLSFAHTLVLALEVIPADLGKAENETVSLREGPGWERICTLLGFFDAYFNLARTLSALWVSVYIFMLAIFQVEMKQRKHEVVGIVVVLFLSGLLPWIPFLFDAYGLANVWCWMKYANPNNSSSVNFIGLQLGIDMLPQFVLSVACACLTLTIVVVFSKGTRAKADADPLLRKRWMLVRETLPLLIYPTLLAVALILNAIDSITLSAVDYDNVILATVTVCVLQLPQLSLPLSLLLHASVRKKLAINSTLKKLPNETLPATVTVTHQTSDTCYIIPPDTLSGENTPLIIKGGSSRDLVDSSIA